MPPRGSLLRSGEESAAGPMTITEPDNPGLEPTESSCDLANGGTGGIRETTIDLAICIAATTLTAVGVAGMVLVRGTLYRGYAFPLLMLASSGYMLVAVLGGGLRRRYGRLIVAALALCWLGDYVGPGRFMTGLAAFLLAHFVFMAAFWVRGIEVKRLVGSIVVVLAVSGGLAFWLFPRVPAADRVPIVAYVLVINAMMVLAGGTRGGPGHLLIVLGAAAFYVSDVLLARGKYVSSGSFNTVIGYPLYYTACMLFAYSAAARRADRVKADRPGEGHAEEPSHA